MVLQSLAHLALAHPAVLAVARPLLVAQHGRFPGREGQHQPALVAVFGHVGDAVLARLAGVDPVVGVEAGVAHAQRARLRRVHARQQVQQFALPIARDAGDADDLAGAQRDRHAVQPRHAQRVAPDQVLGLHQHRAGRTRRIALGPTEVHTPADHGFGQAVEAGAADGGVQHHRAGAHHGHRIAQRHDLLELVRDQQDGRAAVAQAAQGVEQRLGLGRRQHRGRFVQDQDVRAAVQRLQNLQPLALAHRQVGHRGVQLDLQAGVMHQRFELRPHQGARLVQLPVRLGAQHHVVQRAERVDQHEVLVHHAHAACDGVAAALDLRRAAVDRDRAPVGLVEAVQDGHQRALARAVLAHDAVDGALGHHQVDRPVGLHRAEALVDAAHLDGRRRHRRSRHPKQTPRIRLCRSASVAVPLARPPALAGEEQSEGTVPRPGSAPLRGLSVTANGPGDRLSPRRPQAASGVGVISCRRTWPCSR
jgi:hypothetical protein